MRVSALNAFLSKVAENRSITAIEIYDEKNRRYVTIPKGQLTESTLWEYLRVAEPQVYRLQAVDPMTGRGFRGPIVDTTKEQITMIEDTKEPSMSLSEVLRWLEQDRANERAHQQQLREIEARYQNEHNKILKSLEDYKKAISEERELLQGQSLDFKEKQMERLVDIEKERSKTMLDIAKEQAKLQQEVAEKKFKLELEALKQKIGVEAPMSEEAAELYWQKKIEQDMPTKSGLERFFETYLEPLLDLVSKSGAFQGLVQSDNNNGTNTTTQPPDDGPGDFDSRDYS